MEFSRVVITGGASGIGLAAAKYFLSRGSLVVVGDYSDENIAKTRTELVSSSIICLKVDVSIQSEVERLKDEALKFLGYIDFVFLNAGVAGRGWNTCPWDLPTADLKQTLDINFFGIFFGIKTFAPLLIASEARRCAIVCTSSVTGLVPSKRPPLEYIISKQSIISLAERTCLALKALGKIHITVHVLCPFLTDTGFLKDVPLGHTLSGSAVTAEKVISDLMSGVKQNHFYVVTQDHDGNGFEKVCSSIRARADGIAQGASPYSENDPATMEAYEIEYRHKRN